MATMTPTLGAYVKYEDSESRYSRDDVTVIAGQNLAIGTVVARITASRKVTAYNPAGADGSQNAIGIMSASVDATAADTPGVIIARHAVLVARDSLVWAGSPTTPQKDTAMAAMKALGLLSRATV